jgi:hypothetical protein
VSIKINENLIYTSCRVDNRWGCSSRDNYITCIKLNTSIFGNYNDNVGYTKEISPLKMSQSPKESFISIHLFPTWYQLFPIVVYNFHDDPLKWVTFEIYPGHTLFRAGIILGSNLVVCCIVI